MVNHFTHSGSPYTHGMAVVKLWLYQNNVFFDSFIPLFIFYPRLFIKTPRRLKWRLMSLSITNSEFMEAYKPQKNNDIRISVLIFSVLGKPALPGRPTCRGNWASNVIVKVVTIIRVPILLNLVLFNPSTMQATISSQFISTIAESSWKC